MGAISNNDNFYSNGNNCVLPYYQNSNQYVHDLSGCAPHNDLNNALYLKYQENYMQLDLNLRKKTAESQIHVAEVAALSQIRQQEEENKALKREERNEKRLQQFEEIVVDKEGNLRLVLSNPITSRMLNVVANIKFPRIIHLQNISGHGDNSYYMFYGKLIDKTVTLYLDCRKMAQGNYLLNKFCVAGIVWKIKTMAKATDLFAKFITSLANSSKESVLLPEDIGWQVLESGEIIYVEEGELTWKKIIEWAK